MSRPSPSPQSNRSSTQTPSYKNDIKGKSLEQDNKNKSFEFLKVSFTTKCYKYQAYEHLAASCSSLVRITIIDGTSTEVNDPDSYVYILEGEDSKTDEEPTSDDVNLNCINQISSIHLSVVRCVPSQPTEKDDWRKNATFHTFTKMETKIVR